MHISTLLHRFVITRNVREKKKLYRPFLFAWNTTIWIHGQERPIGIGRYVEHQKFWNSEILTHRATLCLSLFNSSSLAHVSTENEWKNKTSLIVQQNISGSLDEWMCIRCLCTVKKLDWSWEWKFMSTAKYICIVKGIIFIWNRCMKFVLSFAEYFFSLDLSVSLCIRALLLYTMLTSSVVYVRCSLC